MSRALLCSRPLARDRYGPGGYVHRGFESLALRSTISFEVVLKEWCRCRTRVNALVGGQAFSALGHPRRFPSRARSRH